MQHNIFLEKYNCINCKAHQKWVVVIILWWINPDEGFLRHRRLWLRDWCALDKVWERVNKTEWMGTKFLHLFLTLPPAHCYNRAPPILPPKAHTHSPCPLSVDRGLAASPNYLSRFQQMARTCPAVLESSWSLSVSTDPDLFSLDPDRDQGKSHAHWLLNSLFGAGWGVLQGEKNFLLFYLS